MPNKQNANQSRQEIERRLKRYEYVSMSQLARIKYAKEYHDQSNVGCEELKSLLKVTSCPVVNIRKVLQKERSGKGGYHTWPIWIVHIIL